MATPMKSSSSSSTRSARTRTIATVLTGAGEAFIDRIDPEGFDFFSPRGYDKIYGEGKKVLSNLLDIPVPVIAALNGATTVHSEYALLADIVIATPDTVSQDKPHFAFGIVPGDDVHSLWPRSSARSAVAHSRSR